AAGRVVHLRRLAGSGARLSAADLCRVPVGGRRSGGRHRDGRGRDLWADASSLLAIVRPPPGPVPETPGTGAGGGPYPAARSRRDAAARGAAADRATAAHA